MYANKLALAINAAIHGREYRLPVPHTWFDSVS